jgi:hypothetical protein
MAIKRRFGEKKGTAKPKGAKGQSYEKKENTKSKQKPRQSIEILVNGSSRSQWLSQ